MVGKNNFAKRIRQDESQAKRERFSIRKLSVGAVSVLLGVTFLGLSNQAVKADTIAAPTQDKEETTNNPQKSAEPTKKENLSTYKGLKGFFSDKKSAKSAKSSSVDQTKTTVKQPETTQDTTNQVKAADATSTETATASSTVPAATEQNSAPVVTDNQSVTPSTSTKQPSVSADKASQTVDQPVIVQAKTTAEPQLAGLARQVTTWQEFVSAIQDANVSEIDLENNIASNVTGGKTNLKFPERQLLIQSDPTKNQRFILDLHYSGPRPDDSLTDTANRGTTDLTYRNLDIYSQSYYGLDNSVDGTSTPCKLTLDNVNFVGSQVTYSGQYSDIYIKGTVNGDAVQSYVSPIDGKSYSCDGGGQQLFELYQPGQNLIFTKDCKFVGSTSDGNVLELDNGVDDNGGPNGRSRTNNILIDSGADVTLNPRKDDGNNGDNAQHSNKASGIAIINGIGTVTVNKRAQLTINVGTDDYTGGLDKRRAAAIMMTSQSGNKAKLIDNGTININTNGDISQSAGGSTKAGTLIYDQGSLTIGPGAALNVFGKNMQDYSGTLIYITGKADLNNGTLDIELQNDPNHPDNPSYGAGNKKIILVDVASSDALTVNNPQKLVLNASNNKVPGTSIIGDSEIDIKNVRQVFNFDKLNPITLPPFHILNVQKKSVGNLQTIGVNKISVLNGNQTISDDAIKAIKGLVADPNNAAIVQILQKAFKTDDIVSYLQDSQTKNIMLDTIFSQVISNAFSDQGNPGYNNITMVSPNQGGFLDIEDDNGVLGQASYHQNADGSITITGKVDNFNAETDGPVQPENAFSKLMTCGMYPYVKAQIRGLPNIYTDGQVSDPYNLTNDVNGDLGHVYSAMANPDGKFSITFPVDTPGIHSGAAVDLTPEANFIGFDPEIAGKSATVYIGNIMGLDQMKLTTEKELDSGLEAANARIKASGLSIDDQQPFLTKIKTAHDDAVYYIDKATDFDTVNYYRGNALDIFNHEAAKSELKAYGQNCVNTLNITDAATKAQIDAQVAGGNGYIDSKFGSNRVENRDDYTPTNQARDFYAEQVLNVCKSWLNSLLKDQASRAKAELDQHSELTNAQQLKDQIDSMADMVSHGVVLAADLDKLNMAYQDAKSKINTLVTQQLSGVLQQEVLENVKNKWLSSRAALMKLTKLTITRQAAYRAELNGELSKAAAAISAATDLANSYQNFATKADAIVAAATAENNQ
ncbi:YSIRK-type signal peptide-containing protein [Lactobacillus sp. ESL0679]|uniref:pectate lyase-like adhesive domain-containing protein n=1 Tax=Lactobacillus sp. ESL0679 TaxID=2983209 RepID=UPI0023F9B33C|nr:pectate lyase-like adhesive domain-containing protein [Lactobacillus sp. ESL0679]MDF7683424.1 YSIRK-type signal peptide-containing protein [Lactobacillus sp. ESL0679]